VAKKRRRSLIWEARDWGENQKENRTTVLYLTLRGSLAQCAERRSKLGRHADEYEGKNSARKHAPRLLLKEEREGSLEGPTLSTLSNQRKRTSTTVGTGALKGRQFKMREKGVQSHNREGEFIATGEKSE